MYITLQDDDVILDELNIEVQIYSQYVKVSVDAVVFNPHDGVQLADFNLRLPEQAFISYFHMWVFVLDVQWVNGYTYAVASIDALLHL